MKKNKLKSNEIELTIPFHDLDPLQIVWHGNYLKYFDRARFALFKSLDVDLYELSVKTDYIFPVTKTFTKHIIPLRHNEKIICRNVPFALFNFYKKELEFSLNINP